MAYDSERGVTVLYGGQNVHRDFQDDTWEWDGETWRRIIGLDPRPPRTIAHAMAYDSRRGVVVLYGGIGISVAWEYRGAR
jgi:hypothetical protein